MRFEDPPYETVGSISSLLHQPSHLINLVVQPIQCKTTSNLDRDACIAATSLPWTAAVQVTKEGRDPYCIFRENYCNTESTLKRSASVRQKCNFAEMNKLVSQLAEVSICLQRTRQECELIEKRCCSKEKSKEADSSSALCDGGGGASFDKTVKHSVSSSSYGSDSGKGSMVDQEALDEVVEEEEEVDSTPVEGGNAMTTQEAGDTEVERLLQIAQLLTRQVQQQQQKRGIHAATVEVLR